MKDEGGVPLDTSQPGREVQDLLPLSQVDFLILLALSEGESHGYGLVKSIRRLSRTKTRLMPGNLYAMLRRLQKDGLIEELERREVNEDQDRRRRYYGITPLGRQAAMAEAERMRSLVQVAYDLIGDASRP